MSLINKDTIIQQCADGYRTASGTTAEVKYGELGTLISQLGSGDVESNFYFNETTPPTDTTKYWIKCAEPTSIIIKDDVPSALASGQGCFVYNKYTTRTWEYGIMSVDISSFYYGTTPVLYTIFYYENGQWTSFDANTRLLLHCDDFTDSSHYGLIVTNSGATIDTTTKKFGTGSYKFNAQGQSVSIPSESLGISGNEFTIDFWICPTSVNISGNVISVFGIWDTGKYGLLLNIDKEYKEMSLAYTVNNSTSANFLNTTWSIPLNSWTHIAIVKSSNELTIYRNGISVGVKEISGNISSDPTEPLMIGCNHNVPADRFEGYIDEFRVSNIARWSENFTPPDAPYSS